MELTQTALPDVLSITPKRFGDTRGWFSEVWNTRQMQAAGIDTVFVQDNHSYSARKGTVRGLHYQAPPHAQEKLVRCSRGAILDVVVDFRAGSPFFGKWDAIELSAENGRQLLVPAGFLHGFLTLSDDCEIQYKCSDYYAPECDGAVRWDDPDIAIDWAGLGGDAIGSSGPILSAKDADAPFLADVQSPFVWGRGK